MRTKHQSVLKVPASDSRSVLSLAAVVEAVARSLAFLEQHFSEGDVGGLKVLRTPITS